MRKKDQLYNVFKKLKFKEDFLIIHSDILSFHRFKFDLNIFFKILSECLGRNKTLIFPSFNLKKRKTWYLNSTKSEAGILSEYIRKNENTVRSLHPIHSVCIYGPKKKQIPLNKSISSFGKNSCWDWLCNSENVRNVSIGIGFVGGATFCHYAEEKAKVNYRYYKKINTLVYDAKNHLIKKKFLFFARKRGFKNSWKNCEKDLKRSKILIKHKNTYNIPIFSMNTKLASKFILKKISKDNKYLTKK